MPGTIKDTQQDKLTHHAVFTVFVYANPNYNNNFKNIAVNFANATLSLLSRLDSGSTLCNRFFGWLFKTLFESKILLTKKRCKCVDYGENK